MSKELINGNGIPEPTEEELATIESELKEIEGKDFKNYLFDYKAKDTVEADDLLELYFTDLPKIIKFNTLEEDTGLAKRIESGDSPEEARDTFYYSIARIAISEALKKRGRGTDVLDLIQEANMGILRAIEKYDWRRGNKFSTYATHWIRSKINRALATDSGPIAIPVEAIYSISRLKRIRQMFSERHDRKPSPEELAIITDMTPEDAEDLLNTARLMQVKSFSTPVERGDGESEEEFGDFIEDKSALYRDELEDKIDLSLLKGTLNKVLADIPLREAMILVFRKGYGFTLEDTGAILNVTKQRIKQLETKALGRVQCKEVRQKLAPYS